jgi:sulfur carrier protein
MVITINNQSKSISSHSSITVLQILNLEIPHTREGIAVAVNNEVVPKAAWETKMIYPNDSVLIIRATQGG